VAVTSGLLARLDRDELQGVIGHELGHIRNRDVLLMIMAGIMLGTIVLLADVGRRSWLWGGRLRTRASPDRGGGGRAILLAVAIVVMISAPLMARLLYLAISRKREYLADASSVQFTRYPEGLASALEKISGRCVRSGARIPRSRRGSGSCGRWPAELPWPTTSAPIAARRARRA
jgi:heat shock protein HtpX